MKKKIIYPLLIILAGITGVCSCSTNSAVAPKTITPAHPVSIKNFAFVPDTIRVSVGNTVTWTNTDSAPHTVTDLNSTFNSGNLSTEQTFNYKFATAGTYSYHCLIHTMMKTAVVIVTN